MIYQIAPSAQINPIYRVIICTVSEKFHLFQMLQYFKSEFSMILITLIQIKLIYVTQLTWLKSNAVLTI